MAGAFVERLAVALRHRGHDVRIVAPSDEGKGGWAERYGIPVTSVRYGPATWETLAYRGTMVTAVRSPRGALALTFLLRAQARAIGDLSRAGPMDIVHAHWWIPGGISAWLARAPSPYVVTLHGTDVAILERSALARFIARRVLRGAAAITAVSRYLAERAARVAGLEARAIVVQPMPADVGKFTRLSRGGGGVVTVGRLSEQKRIGLILEALAQLRRGGRALPLTIVGDGPERPVLERRAEELGIAASTRFLGRVAPEEIPGAIGDADVFAFPARGEGFGLAAAEALMLGVPVVAARDGGGVTDVVPAAGAGRLVPSGDASELARAIEELIRDPDNRRLAAEAGAALKRRLEPAAVAEVFESVYARVLEQRGRHRHA